ncbi:thymidine phosphorylase family protein [Ensifer adhaerens]|uniref:thymidine phosphorylase family protein n=1 Tax=Ensifer adhaerens TaxID=106592 RepID=UPI001C4E0036|nr:thymidine phosphorylase family protein [Ensifer adhaerens]MBW0366682.1 thymidine phosphorylase family protein [Ensifer adhaerens]UCM21938.1 thymidine phosphorylase family protein [Ensifer adhaerens]
MSEAIGPKIPDRDSAPHRLRAKRLGVLTSDEPVVFMRSDCPACRSEGLSSRSRVLLRAGEKSVIATLFQVSADWLDIGQAGLSNAAWELLDVQEDVPITVHHPDPLTSFSQVRARIFGNRLDAAQFREILDDIAARRYSGIETAAYLVSGSSFPLDREEMVALTRVMVDIGETLTWQQSPVVDKHCVGGLPGNRTTPIIVAIVAALGLTMPKTSSRAITSPAGTADAMETLAPVDLDLPAIRRVVDLEGGCIVWGGAVRLSPADDLLIRVERVLDLDSEGQLVASVLSKKVAAGASHLVLDIPVGPTAKLRTSAAGEALSVQLASVAARFGIATSVVITDGSQPVGVGVGPALEARDVLAVLQQTPGFPEDLHARACALAGALLELSGKAAPGEGAALAALTIANGVAWAKFQRICEAQGGMRVPPSAKHRRPRLAESSGHVTAIDNRRIARIAKLAGAPGSKAAGVEMHARVGDRITAGQPMFSVHAETSGELEYALAYADANPEAIQIDEGRPKEI